MNKQSVSEIIKDEGQAVEVHIQSESVWLTQRQMGDVFETTPENILMHLKKYL